MTEQRSSRPWCEFRLRTTSALFMHGAQRLETAELRAASVRGVARYWFRALLGPYAEVAVVRDAEARVFGSTTTGRGVVFLVEPAAPQVGASPLLPHKSDRPSVSKCIPAKTGFTVRLWDVRRAAGDGHLRAAAWSLWCAAHLGGFGQRSRRGGGSVVLEGIESSACGELPPPTVAASDAGTLKDYLEPNLRKARAAVRALVPAQSSAQLTSPPRFPMLVEARRGAVDARAQIVLLEATHEQAARAEVMLSLRPFKNAIFGLPYMNTAPGDARITRDRLASPLWIHLHPLGTGRFVAVRTLLRSSSAEKLCGGPAGWAKMEQYLAAAPGAVELVL